MAVIPTVLHQRDFGVNKQQMSGVFRPMRLVYMICTAMFGNGAAINGTIIITVHRLTEVLGKLAQIITGCSVADPVTTMRSIAVVPLVTGVRRAIATGTSVFVLLWFLCSLRFLVLCCS